MVLENLGDKLRNALKKVARSVFVDKRLIDEIVKDIQRALLEADVNVELVLELSKNIKKRALEEEPAKNISQKEYIIKVVYEELVNFLGESKGIEIDKSKKPFKVMLVGVFGNGKTTFAGKLAKYYNNRGFKVGTLGLDVHRAKATEQLYLVSKEANVNCFVDESIKDPIKVYNKFSDKYKNLDILIIDTAGRDSVDKTLINEIKKLNEVIKPDETLLVIGADLGQGSKEIAEAFNQNCKITGIVITKMDGTARGGGALVACSVSGSPVKFLSVGEKINDIEIFKSSGFVSRLLGMGDLEALLEKSKEVISEEKAEDLGKRLLKGEFNFLDLYEQMQAMKKLGPLNKIMELIPGMSNLSIPKEMLDVQDEKLEKWKYMFDSMTKEELENPELLDSGRMNRIAKGSGVNVNDVRELLKHYRQGRKMIKMMKGKNLDKMMKKFKLSV